MTHWHPELFRFFPKVDSLNPNYCLLITESTDENTQKQNLQNKCEQLKSNKILSKGLLKQKDSHCDALKLLLPLSQENQRYLIRYSAKDDTQVSVVVSVGIVKQI